MKKLIGMLLVAVLAFGNTYADNNKAKTVLDQPYARVNHESQVVFGSYYHYHYAKVKDKPDKSKVKNSYGKSKHKINKTKVKSNYY